MRDASLNEKLDEILAEYVMAEESDAPVCREDLLQKYPEFALELKRFFADRDQFKRLASPLSPEAARRNDLPATVRYFGDYELLEEIAQGGMGVVYKARQTSLNRIVAVKMILAGHLATDADVQRFTDEARTAASLKHKAIVPIHEVGQQNGQHYFSMDLIEGRNLAEVIRTDLPKPDEAARIIKAIAEAVDYAHGQGLVHRDIKPSNILLDNSGQLHVTDFGLALRVEGESELTRTGQVLGTPSYMPPEQAQAKRDLVGRASDIYSLGAVLYELLAGRPPFRGESPADTIRQLIDEEPLPPRRLSPNAPLDLETICLKCLEKEPHKRYGTAALLADDLRRYLSGTPILARRSGPLERIGKWARRKPAQAALVSVSCTAVLILMIGLVVSNVVIRDALDDRTSALAEKTVVLGELRRQEGETRDALEKLTTAHQDIKRTLASEERTAYNRAIALVHREWFANNVANAERILDELPEHLRGWEYDYLRRICHLEVRTVDWETDAANSIAFSPNGKLLAAGGGNVDFGDRGSGSVRVWDLESGDVRFTFQEGIGPVFRIAFSPNGKHLASCDKDELVKVWSVETGDEVASFECDDWATDVLFNKDGSQLISTGGGVIVWDLASGKEVRRVATGALSLALNPEGNTLACASNRSVDLLDFESGKQKGVLEGLSSNTYGATFSPDGKLFAAATLGGAVHIWNVEDGAQIQTLHGHASAAYRLAFSKSGKLLISVGGDYSEGSAIPGDAKVWQVSNGKEVVALRGHLTAVTDVAIHPNDDRVATVTRTGKIKIWDRRAWSDKRVFKGSGGGTSLSNLEFSARGQYLATPQGNKLKVVNTSTWEERHVATATFKRHATSVAFNPEGTRVAFTDSPGRLRVIEIASGEESFSIRTTNGSSPSVAYAPDGRIVTVAGGEGTIWDPNTGALIDTFAGSLISTSANGRHLAYLKDGKLHIWSSNSRREVAFSSRRIPELAVSDDGKVVATGGTDKLIKLWDAETAEEIVTMPGHTGPITGISIHPDGRRVASCSSDTTVKIWDAESGQELVTLRPNIREVYDVAFSPDGRILAARNISGTVAIWSSGH